MNEMGVHVFFLSFSLLCDAWLFSLLLVLVNGEFVFTHVFANECTESLFKRIKSKCSEENNDRIKKFLLS